MDRKQVSFFIILLFVIAIPTAYAQISVGEEAKQKSVEIIINSSNEIHVKHVVIASNSPKQIQLVDGTKNNLKVTDIEGEESQFGVIGENNGLIIFPSKKNSVVEYDLDDVLFLKDNVWTLDYRYLQTTNFIFPKEIELVYVNKKPVRLGEKDGIACHGCQMTLEYSINEPKILKNIKLENKEFLIEIRTFAEINQFNFDQTTKSISFDVNGENQFVTTIIPLELSSRPYNVYMGDEKIFFHEYINNGTHVWLNIRPDNSGNVSIIGATVISDEKSTIQNNPSTSVSNVNQDIIVYILLGVIVLIGLVVMAIIIRKKKLLVTSREIQDNNT